MSFHIVALIYIPISSVLECLLLLVLTLFGIINQFSFWQFGGYEIVSYYWFNLLGSEVEVSASAGRQDTAPFQIFIDCSFSSFAYFAES